VSTGLVSEEGQGLMQLGLQPRASQRSPGLGLGLALSSPVYYLPEVCRLGLLETTSSYPLRYMLA